MTPIRLVLDASVALAWLLGRDDAQEARQAEHLLEIAHDAANAAPPIWRLEIANGALRAERSQRISVDQLSVFNQLLNRLPVTPDASHAAALIPLTYQLARAHALTIYDASYLELALRRNSYLATFDRKLADAARASGVAVLGQPHGVAEPMLRYS